MDYDIIPDTLTVTGGARWYQYREYEVGSQYETGTGCLNVPNGQCSGGVAEACVDGLWTLAGVGCPA